MAGPRSVSYLKRTVKRTAWSVDRFKRASAVNYAPAIPRTVGRVLGPFWDVVHYAATYCLYFRQRSRSQPVKNFRFLLIINKLSQPKKSPN
jgi:hypothetical protein